MPRKKMLFLPITDPFYGMGSELVRSWARAVGDAVPELDVVFVPPDADPRSELATADAVFGILNPDLLKAAKKMVWLQGPAASPLAGFYFPELIKHPVVISNIKGTYRANLANHLLAFILAFARCLPYFMENQKQGRWAKLPPEMPLIDLGRTTALILGAGYVGSATAERCKAFGIRTIAVDLQTEGLAPVYDEVHSVEHLDRLLPRADWVVMSLPHTPRTEGMIDARRLALMKKSAYLFNVGRGATIRLDDLVSALHKGTIGGAGLDVFEVEPLPEGHPLWRAPNLILTPHSSGGGEDIHAGRVKFLIENARRFAAAQPLLNIVDKKDWF